MERTVTDLQSAEGFYGLYDLSLFIMYTLL